MIDFLDEDVEVNAFCVGFSEALRHPTALYPEAVPTGLPENLIEDAKKKYGQYNAGFYIGKVILIIAIAAASYFGVPQLLTL